jgi:hypothetical protein
MEGSEESLESTKGLKRRLVWLCSRIMRGEEERGVPLRGGVGAVKTSLTGVRSWWIGRVEWWRQVASDVGPVSISRATCAESAMLGELRVCQAHCAGRESGDVLRQGAQPRRRPRQSGGALAWVGWHN